MQSSQLEFVMTKVPTSQEIMATMVEGEADLCEHPGCSKPYGVGIHGIEGDKVASEYLCEEHHWAKNKSGRLQSN